MKFFLFYSKAESTGLAVGTAVSTNFEASKEINLVL